MDRLLTFFKHSDTEFGIFYPKHYLVASYPNLQDAEHATLQLRDAGWADDDLIAVSGEDVVRYQEDQLVMHGLWGLLMSQLSRFIGTEEAFADADLAAAKRGVAFIAAHCHTEVIKDQAWEILGPTHPIIARYYDAGGIEHMSASA
jgi:hypothetical protein